MAIEQFKNSLLLLPELLALHHDEDEDMVNFLQQFHMAKEARSIAPL